MIYDWMASIGRLFPIGTTKIEYNNEE